MIPRGPFQFLPFCDSVKKVLLDPLTYLCDQKHKGSCFETKRAKRHSPVLINNAGNILAPGSPLQEGVVSRF